MCIIYLLSINHLKYVNSNAECTVLSYYDWPSSADILSQQPCVQDESSISEAATDTNVGATTGDTNKGERNEYQADSMKGTRQREKDSSAKKGMHN